MEKVILGFLHIVVFLYQISADEHLGQIHINKDFETLLLNCNFPDYFPLTLEYKDVKLEIQLFTTKDFNTPAPVYVMSSQRQAIQEHLITGESSVAYHDKNKIAAIVVTCSNYHRAKRPFTLEGKVFHRGRIINIEPVDRDSYQFNVYRFSSSALLSGIDSLLIGDHVRKTRKKMKERLKRQSRASEYKVDVLIVTDYTIYENWLELAPHPNPVIKRLETIANIRKYYTVAYNWVNLIFQNFPARDFHIQAFITGIIISENKNTSFLTEPYRNGTTIWGLDVLHSMVAWVKNATEGDIPQNDHIQLFSRLDFTADKALRMKGNKGKSYTGSLCKINSVSYVEELGGFNSADIAAHELTHSLGASHDGENNWCSSDTRNLMAIYFNPNIARSNLPSDCTIYDVRVYMRLQTRRNPKCTLERFNVSNDVPKMDGVFPGMVYEADAQCQQIHGPTSFHCRNYLPFDENEFCESSLFCYDPVVGLCDTQVPALGTPCANKSWCIDTKCTYDDRAPSRESKCLFGDLPVGYYNLTETGESCEQRVKSAPFECYDEFFRRMCCKSCAGIKRQTSGCEYGDRLTECFDVLCGKRVKFKGWAFLYDIKCCETCKFHGNGPKPYRYDIFKPEVVADRKTKQ